MPAHIEDGADFNNPDAWGFCEWCAFDVAVTIPDGVRVDHRRNRTNHDTTSCHGSGRVTALPSPYTAEAVEMVSFKKPLSRTKSRAYWLRVRLGKREKYRALRVKAAARLKTEEDGG